MVFSYQKIPSFLPKYGYFPVLNPWGFQSILITVRKQYRTYSQKSRVIEKIFDAVVRGRFPKRKIPIGAVLEARGQPSFRKFGEYQRAFILCLSSVCMATIISFSFGKTRLPTTPGSGPGLWFGWG